MIKKYIVITFLITILCCASSKKINFNPIENKIESRIENRLLSLGYEKMTYYYDNSKKKSGEWDLFPWADISKDYILINVSKIPNNKTSYNYLIVYSKKQNEIIFTSKPFFDNFFKTIYFERVKSNYQIIVKSILEGEGHEEEITIMNLPR